MSGLFPADCAAWWTGASEVRARIGACRHCGRAGSGPGAAGCFGIAVPCVVAGMRVGGVAVDGVEDFLAAQGYRVVARDYSTPWARFDFICRDGPVLAFVQVRDARKARVRKSEREALARAAAEFLASRGWWHFVCRFDMVVVRAGDPPEVRLIKDAV